MNTHSASRGFTLTEMAIVLLIVSFLIGGLLIPFGAQNDAKYYSETEQSLATIQEALLGFAIANGRLPCPALATTATGTAGAGEEATNGLAGSSLACTNVAGVLPWVTLGVTETDAWGRRYSYRVTTEFARGATGQTAFNAGCDPTSDPQSAAFALCSEGNMEVLSTSGSSSKVAIDIPAVIISHGKNGNGAYTNEGIQRTVSADADETENELTTNGTATANTDFVSKAHTDSFDDVLTWIPPGVLFSRMVAAGKLP